MCVSASGTPVSACAFLSPALCVCVCVCSDCHPDGVRLYSVCVLMRDLLTCFITLEAITSACPSVCNRRFVERHGLLTTSHISFCLFLSCLDGPFKPPPFPPILLKALFCYHVAVGSRKPVVPFSGSLNKKTMAGCMCVVGARFWLI